MTDDIKLLPLPESLRRLPAWSAIEYYTRANVAHATAAQAAEIEALRAEVRELKADRDSWEQQASDRVADWHDEHKRAERLAEALRNLLDVGDKFTGDKDEDAATWCDVTDAARVALHPTAAQEGK